MAVQTQEARGDGGTRNIAKRGGFYGSHVYIENRDSAPGAVAKVEFFKDVDGVPTGYEYLDSKQFLQITDFDMLVCSVGYRDRPPVGMALWNDSVEAEIWIFKENAGRRQYIDYLPPPDAKGSFSFGEKNGFYIAPGEVFRFLAVEPLKK